MPPAQPSHQGQGAGSDEEGQGRWFQSGASENSQDKGAAEINEFQRSSEFSLLEGLTSPDGDQLADGLEGLLSNALDINNVFDPLEGAVALSIFDDALGLGRPDARDSLKKLRGGAVEVDEGGGIAFVGG